MTSRELEIEQLKLALARTEENIARAHEALGRLSHKRAAQFAELRLQEYLREHQDSVHPRIP